MHIELFTATMDKAEEPQCQTGTCYLTDVPYEIFDNFTNRIDIVSLKYLVLTCRGLASSLRPILIQRDIDSRTYNSLAWACFFNQVDLGRACLELGANPNAAFFREDRDKTRLSFYEKENYPDLYQKRKHREESMHPVFPTKTVFGVPLFLESGCASRSALNVAVYRDNVDMVKLLLEFGAALIEMRPKINLEGLFNGHPSQPIGTAGSFSHPNALCHVRSVSMAKALFEAGAARHVNFAGVSGYTPLEMVLATCSRYKIGQEVELTEPELRAVVKLFLDNGAQTRRQSLAGGSLLGAIATDYFSVIKLILDHCNFNPADEMEDHGTALELVLGEHQRQNCFDDETSLPSSTQARILNMMLAAGLSPHYDVPGMGPVLQTVLKDQPRFRYFFRSVQTIINSVSDLNHTSPTVLSPLATAVVSVAHDDDEDNIVTLVRAGAGLDHPSLWAGGFTPLMFATGDPIPVRAFGNLVRFGSDLGAVRKLSPKGPSMSVLQCLLTGFPEQHFGWEDEMDADLYRRGVADVKFKSDDYTRSPIPEGHYEVRRREKFRVFIEGGLRGAHFYTSNARHVLNWALENLYYQDLEWALEMLLPHYQATKMPGDTESPIWALFSLTRVENYLQFGVMTQTLRIAEMLLKHGVAITTEDREQGQTILHRIAQLPNGEPTMFNLTRATECGKPLDFAQEGTSLHAVRWEDEFSSSGAPHFRSTTHPWTRLPRSKHLKRYVDARNHVIAQMVALFIRHGIDFHARDGNGKTAYELFHPGRPKDIIDRIPMELRDLRKEKAILDEQEAILDMRVEALEKEVEKLRPRLSEGSKKEQSEDEGSEDAP